MNPHVIRPLVIASRRLLIAALSFFCLACPPLAFAASRATPDTSTSGVPTITLAPPGVHGFPFASSSLNLAADGYTEIEYDFSGTATAYINTAPLAANGQWSAAPNPGITAAYTSRLLVRSPSDPSKFNGTVIVEWFNDSAGFDTNTDWEYLHSELLAEGYAWVGVTAQYVGAIALQAWEAGEPGNRYASINHPGDSFSYDIFSQAGRALIEPPAGGPQPLGALTGSIKAVLAVGYSQSGFAMLTYVNAIQPLAKVYNGFILHSVGYGLPLSINTASFANPTLPAPPGVPPTPTINVPLAFVRTDRPAPIVALADEYTNVYLYEGVTLHLEPDNGKFHLWEIAGMTHFDPIIGGYPDLLKTYPGFASPFATCTIPPPNTGVPGSYAERAIVQALNQWVILGVVPTSAPRFELETFPITGYTKIFRDPATHIALGGIRLPAVAAPIATITGDRPELGDITCGPQVGAYDPWDGNTDPWDGIPGLDPSPTPEPVLSTLYPTHADYVHQVAASAAAAVASGFLTPADEAAAIAQAESSSVP
jgi:hypothetical protein